MSWYADMSKEIEFTAGDHIRAVGWLSAKHRFPKGDVPVEFLARLKQLVSRSRESAEALGWPFARGWHVCELCYPEGGGFKSLPDPSCGTLNLGIPCGQLLFAAPELIGHYVEKHQYRPPDEFIAAAMQSPLPGTEEFRAIAQPFRPLYFRYLLRRSPKLHQKCLSEAVQWAYDRRHDDGAVREAALRFFRDESPEVCERIRLAVQQYRPQTEPALTVSASGAFPGFR